MFYGLQRCVSPGSAFLRYRCSLHVQRHASVADHASRAMVVRLTVVLTALSHNILIASACETTVPLFKWLIKQGGNHNLRVDTYQGLRGLVTTKEAAPGDVLLEVPLRATLSDGYDGDTITGTPPAWCRALSENIQLAVCLLRHKQSPEWTPFFASWPEQVPMLPKDLDSDDLEEVQDEPFETEAESLFFWLAERYFDACEEHSAASEAESMPSEEELWSRSIRLNAGSHGTRRLFVPVLDLANHEAIPSALFSYSDNGACGPAVRLHAARALRLGEAVTISYGDHPSSHFAMYYGFVPSHNPFDHVFVDVADLLDASSSPVQSPRDGWKHAISELERAGHEMRTIPMYAAFPTNRCLVALKTVLVDVAGVAEDEADLAALRIILSFCENFEAQCETTSAEDEALLQEVSGTEGLHVLVQLRLARKCLLRTLGTNVAHFLQEVTDKPTTSSYLRGRIRERQTEADPVVYPALQKLPDGEGVIRRWASQVWDWTLGAYRNA
eukprot:TRINITY_DN18024_c0_g1_i2.p1 TRINITY_DN18024_c0_g1~~TRINITY_DN18024_c0_g1_i2.p1  ORF type:complete len:500 (-),score=58.55 TRINITY_DN18024_c0_g1_i2:224-1723(-)